MSFLDTIIPIIIAIVFGFILISAFKKPLGAIWDWLRGLFSNARERAQERKAQITIGREIVYE